MPWIFYALGALFPTTYFIALMRAIILRGANFFEYWPNLAVLIVMSSDRNEVAIAADRLPDARIILLLVDLAVIVERNTVVGFGRGRATPAAMASAM